MIGKFQGKTRWLSNFALAEIELDDKKYPTTEHAFQAAKTLDETEREKVRLAKTPGKAKRLGMKVTLRPDWDNIKVEIMKNLNRQKYEIPEYREKLLGTGDQELVEGNTWNDTFWGKCQEKGSNHLGRILMEIREEIKDETVH